MSAVVQHWKNTIVGKLTKADFSCDYSTEIALCLSSLEYVKSLKIGNNLTILSKQCDNIAAQNVNIIRRETKNNCDLTRLQQSDLKIYNLV